MTHVQIDDDFFDHPKVLSVSKDAKLLAVAAICYAGNMLTDGFIPFGCVSVLAAKTGVTRSSNAVNELIAARLWEPKDGGYQVHDYLDYNTSAEKVRANRDAAKERARRTRSQEVRANFAKTSPEVREPTTTTTVLTRSHERVSPLPPKSIKTPVPENFTVPPDVLDAMATEQGMTSAELHAETAKMIDYYISKGERRNDWVRTWRNWMRSDYRKPRGSPAANGREDATITADRDKLLADQLANDPQAYLSWGKR